MASLPRNPEMEDEEWERHKEFLLQDAFCLTISIRGERDQQLFGETSEIFESSVLPNPIKSVYFNNITAWRRNDPYTDPPNRMEILLDFSKPPLLDPTSVLSEPTPNDSNASVRADDMMFFRAVRHVIDTKIRNHRTWYSVIHRSFAYDAGVWLLVLPAGLVVITFYMDKWFPLDSDWENYRWAFFVYALGIVVLGYRFLSGYAKWAFPVNVLTDNKDRSLQHRVALGGILVALCYKAAETVYGLLPFAS